LLTRRFYIVVNALHKERAGTELEQINGLGLKMLRPVYKDLYFYGKTSRDRWKVT
jgi:hypothetical protein